MSFAANFCSVACVTIAFSFLPGAIAVAPHRQSPAALAEVGKTQANTSEDVFLRHQGPALDLSPVDVVNPVKASWIAAPLYRNLLLANLGFIVLAVFCIYPSTTARSAGSGGFLGLKTVSQISIFIAYVTLACTHTFTQHQAGRTGYSVVSATALIYFAKFVVALCMYLTRGTGKFSDALQPAGDYGQPRFGRVPVFMLLAVPAMMLSFYDVLSFMTLGRMDPVTYQVLRSGRIILVAGVWQPALGRRLSTVQLGALVFFVAASLSKGIDQLGGAGEFTTTAMMNTGVMFIMGQVLLSVFANVASEVCLKQIPLHTDLINTVSYLSGLIALSIYLVCTHGARGIYEQLLAPKAWALLFGDVWMCASVVNLVAFGIITAYFLRDLSNILKELSFSFVILVTAGMEYIVLGHGCTLLGTSAVMLTVLAIMVYNSDPLATGPAPPGK